MPEGAVKRTNGFSMARQDGRYSAIHIANLGNFTTETNLEDLVKPFGLCKCFAYIYFKFRNDLSYFSF